MLRLMSKREGEGGRWKIVTETMWHWNRRRTAHTHTHSRTIEMQPPHDLENETNFICSSGKGGMRSRLCRCRLCWTVDTHTDAQILQLFAALCNCTRQHSFLLHKEQCVCVCMSVCVCECGEWQERDKATIRIRDKNLTRLSARSCAAAEAGTVAMGDVPKR